MSQHTEATDNRSPDKKHAHGQVYEWLGHPLVLLILGGLLTGWLLPSILSQAQDRQKELDLKTNMVGQVSNAVANLTTELTFAEFAPKQTDKVQQSLDAAYLIWQVQSSVIEAQLQAYFEKKQLADEWSNYINTLTNFYRMVGVNISFQIRSNLVDQEKKYYDHYRNVLWSVLLDRNDGRYSSQWLALRQDILSDKDRLVKEMLQSSISGYGTGISLNWP